MSDHHIGDDGLDIRGPYIGLAEGIETSLRERGSVVLDKAGWQTVIDSLHSSANGNVDVPIGWAVVPIEPSLEMLYAAKHAMRNTIAELSPEGAKKLWGKPRKHGGYRVPTGEKHTLRYQAMLDAAPSPKIPLDVEPAEISPAMLEAGVRAAQAVVTSGIALSAYNDRATEIAHDYAVARATIGAALTVALTTIGHLEKQLDQMRADHLGDFADRLTSRSLEALEDDAHAACFHYFCCGDDNGCGQLKPAMADLARASGFTHPGADDDIAAIPVSSRKAAQKSDDYDGEALVRIAAERVGSDVSNLLDAARSFPKPPAYTIPVRPQENTQPDLELHQAYLKLRNIIPGAYDTPVASSPEHVWAHTEKCAADLVEKNQQYRKVLELARGRFESILNGKTSFPYTRASDGIIDIDAILSEPKAL